MTSLQEQQRRRKAVHYVRFVWRSGAKIMFWNPLDNQWKEAYIICENGRYNQNMTIMWRDTVNGSDCKSQVHRFDRYFVQPHEVHVNIVLDFGCRALNFGASRNRKRRYSF